MLAGTVAVAVTLSEKLSAARRGARPDRYLRDENPFGTGTGIDNRKPLATAAAEPAGRATGPRSAAGLDRSARSGTGQRESDTQC
jgi:hypothetical protein